MLNSDEKEFVELILKVGNTLFGRLAELAEYIDGDAINETVYRCPSKVQ